MTETICAALGIEPMTRPFDGKPSSSRGWSTGRNLGKYASRQVRGRSVMYIVRIGVLDDMLMAQELSMAHVLSEVAKTDPKLRGAIEKGFEDAILDAEVLAMKEGKTERGQRSSHVLAIIEHIRDITLGNSKRAREAKAADIKEVARAAEERKREELQRDAADKAERALVWCDMEDGTRRAPATLSGKL